MDRLARALTVGLVAPVVAVSGAAAPVAAAPPERGSFTDTFQDGDGDFCDSGRTVVHSGTATGRFLVRERGKDGPAYVTEHLRFEVVTTDQETGDHVRLVDRVVTKDLRVTDNGNGTMTVLVLATGSSTLYDSAGTALARNPGQVRFEILIDHGGTPGDLSDDQFLAFLGEVKESTGRTDDYCAAALAAFG